MYATEGKVSTPNIKEARNPYQEITLETTARAPPEEGGTKRIPA
jgi:hypothetical protein